MVTAGIGGAYLDVTHGLAPSSSCCPRPRATGARATRRDVRAAAGDYPSVEDSRAWVTPAGKPWRQGVVLAATRASSRRRLTHFTIFLLLLLIFWQGVRANETGRIIDAYLSATRASCSGSPAAARRGAARLRHLPAADGVEDDRPCCRSGE
jgi:hypothetical protein